MDPLLEVFDVATTDQPIAARISTTVAPQVLTLLNSRFIAKRAKAAANRLMKDGPTENPQKLSRRRSIQKQKLLAPHYRLRPRGEAGLWCSDKFPHLAKHMDKLWLVKSLYSDSFAHGSALLQMNSGRFI